MPELLSGELIDGGRIFNGVISVISGGGACHIMDGGHIDIIGGGGGSVQDGT